MAAPEVDLSQLSEAQQLALQQYTSVTDQETGAAIALLQRSQWNVEIAIAKFFDGEGPDPVAEALAAQNMPHPRTSIQENLQESLLRGSTRNSRSQARPEPAPRIVPQPEDQITQRPSLLFTLLFTPFTILYKIFSSSFRMFYVIFPFLPRLFGPLGSAGRAQSNTTGRRALKPRDSAARFKREFEEEYGTHDLQFFDGGYAQALDLAKKDLKFLLVFLTSPEHDDTNSFIHDTLLSTDVQAFINNPSHNIILWAGNVQDSEAYQVSAALRCTKFPFTALITHTPEQGSTSMSIICRLAGSMPAGTYTSKLQNGITAHQEQLATVRAARSAQNFERTLRQEQDSAYERSLAQDRERARQRKAAEAAAAEAEKEALAEAEAARIFAEKKSQWRQWRAGRIGAEPRPEEKDVVRIALKMPQAARVMRRFPSDAEIEELYAFVDCYDILQEGTPVMGIAAPQDYEHKFNFRLVSTLPRVMYEVTEGGKIGERIGRSGNLIVESIANDDEDDEDEDEE